MEAAYRKFAEEIENKSPQTHANCFVSTDRVHLPFALPLDKDEPQKQCYLFTIPRELRDMISDIAISSGDISILHLSKQLHDEGIGLLYKRRICHLIIGPTNWTRGFSLEKPIAALIQNVTIEILLYDGTDSWCWRDKRWGEKGWGKIVRPLRSFSGLAVLREACRVVLVFANRLDFRMDRRVPRRVMESLQTLHGFSRVILDVRFRDRRDAREKEEWPRLQRAVVLERACKDLSCGLGPSILHETLESDGGYLEFYPRDYLEANPRPSSPVVKRRTDQCAI